MEGAKPRALVIQLCAEVGPCLNDWADELPAMYATYSEVGLDILQVGIFSLDGGPVTEPELLETRESFSVTWHLALEPEPSLSGAVGPQGIPAYLVVDTSSMAITYYAEEGADGALFEAVEAVLFSNP